MDIVQLALKLPQTIEFEGVIFGFQISMHKVELIICYDLQQVMHGSMHEPTFCRYGAWANPFDEGRLNKHLFIARGIVHDSSLWTSLEGTLEWLQEHHLIK